MLAPVGLRFGSLRPATGSRHLPMNGVQNQRIGRLPAEDPGAIRSAAPPGRASEWRRAASAA